MIRLPFIILIFSFIPWALPAQEGEQKKEGGSWEFSLSNIYSYAVRENEGLFKTEFHLIYLFTPKWGTGLSYTHKFIRPEGINDDIALIGSWNPTPYLTVNLGPNFTLPDEEESGFLGLYNEVEFNFRPKEWLSFGPLVGSVISKNTEIYGGIHVGFEF